ncbi:MAG: hypothetical protein K9L30_06770 [Desulfobacterales bacterium]|nr:hypothetical protein [Desulfobacterales bacterium]
MQIISNIALISINETLIVQLISFLIFLFIMKRIMFQPLEKVMEDREKHINKVTEDIADSKRALIETEKQIDMEEAAAKKEAFLIKEERESAGSEEADKIFAVVRDDIAAMKMEADKKVADQLSEARKFIQKESETLSVAIMERILDRKLV